MLIAGNIANAAEQTADSGSSGQSKAVSDGAAGGAAASDPFEQLRQLSELRDAGVLTEEEFDAKKADLLRRI